MIEKLRSQRATWQTVRAQSGGGRSRPQSISRAPSTASRSRAGRARTSRSSIGSGQVLQDFDRALRGIAAGESTTATVLFPQDYPTASLAGKTAVFAITCRRVEERQLPELDDAFAASFGIAGGAGALRGEVRNNMERELKERLRAETKTRVFDALIGANQVVVPRALVDQEISTLQADALRQMGSSDPAQAPPRERFEGLAQRRVTVGLA